MPLVKIRVRGLDLVMQRRHVVAVEIPIQVFLLEVIQGGIAPHPTKVLRRSGDAVACGSRHAPWKTSEPEDRDRNVATGSLRTYTGNNHNPVESQLTIDAHTDVPA